MKKSKIVLTKVMALLVLFTVLLTACSGNGTKADEQDEKISLLEEKIASLEKALAESNEKLEKEINELGNHQYDFYITLGTLPTLYATLNAYSNQNPNTYMWFYRGNTISYEHTADFINYFETQSKTNAYSAFDYSMIREKVVEIKENDPKAEFHLYCDDLRAHFILSIFVQAGVEFEDLDVTLLSDGTGTYVNFGKLNTGDLRYSAFADQWAEAMNNIKENRDTEGFVSPYPDYNDFMDYQYLAFYLTTFPNVEMWVQHPEYLVNADSAVMNEKANMNIVKKNPKDIFNSLDRPEYYNFQKAVLANALVDSDELKTLDDAVAYFNARLGQTDKEVVLILGTDRKTLDSNKYYIDETLNYYTPQLKNGSSTVVVYKGQEYQIAQGASKVTIDGKDYNIGELGVHLYFKGHPAHHVDAETTAYFNQHGIEILPYRTPVEVLFWMYDVKAGGYESTSFLSCNKGQTEFFYENVVTSALVGMKDAGFFDGAAVFSKPQQ